MPFAAWKTLQAALEAQLGAAEKLVLVDLISRAGQDGTCYPGTSDLERRTSLSRSTVVRARDRLRALGVIEWSSGGPGRANTYRIRPPEQWSVGRAPRTRRGGSHGDQYHTDTSVTQTSSLSDTSVSGTLPYTGGSVTQTLPGSYHTDTSITQTLPEAESSVTQTLPGEGGSVTQTLGVVSHRHPNSPVQPSMERIRVPPTGGREGTTESSTTTARVASPSASANTGGEDDLSSDRIRPAGEGRRRRGRGARNDAMADTQTREVVDQLWGILTEAGISGLDTRWYAAACHVVYKLLHTAHPPLWWEIVDAARWALHPDQAKWHARKLLRPRGIPELVQLYQAQVENDGLDWTGVPEEDIRRYRKPGHKLTQAQVNVLKLPKAETQVVDLSKLFAPPHGGVPP
jgi:hypothetical protein